MLRLDTHASLVGVMNPLMLKVLTVEEFIGSQYEPHQVALWISQASDLSEAVINAPWGALYCPGVFIRKSTAAVPVISNPRDPDVVAPGDVIIVFPGSSLVKVLYRRASTANALFITERCNNNCIMCSQPPRDINDQGLFEVNKQLLHLVDKSTPWLGLTGGEPTLDQDAFTDLIALSKVALPDTYLHVLSHGRTFGTSDLAYRVRAVRHPHIQWGIPLYGDVPNVHDGVVRTPGAFDETVAGLMALARAGQSIELRMVLQKATIPRIRQYAVWVARNLPFVECVAFMGLEPMGYARTYRSEVWIDPVDYMEALQEAAFYLVDRGIKTFVYNVPQCLAGPGLRPLLQKSISDWKNIFLPQCEACSTRPECAGVFASTKGEWISRGIAPLVGS